VVFEFYVDQSDGNLGCLHFFFIKLKGHETISLLNASSAVTWANTNYKLEIGGLQW